MGSEETRPVRSLLRHQIHTAANRVRVHVGRERFGHFNCLQQLGGDDVHGHLTQQRVRRRDALAVDHHRVETGFGAAHADIPAFTLILRNRNAGNTLCRFRGVAIGKRSDLIR